MTTGNKINKKALWASALSLLLCVALLVGTTFAWFTDSVTNENNRIQAGTLKIDLLMDKAGNGTYESIANGEGDIFSEATGNGILWEPGKTEIVYLAVQNKGSLALSYNIILDVIDGEIPLSGALEYAILDGKKAGDLDNVDSWEDLKAIADVQVGDIQAGRITAAPNGMLDEIINGEQNETDFFALAVHMKESVGNVYQNGNITIDVNVVAKQAPAEMDGFENNQYDVNATFDDTSTQTGDASYQVSEGGAWASGDFADALANVYDGGTIKLLKDVVLSQTMEITKSMTITSADPEHPCIITSDVNGHGYFLNIYGNENGVTLKDIQIDGGSQQGVTASRALIAVGTKKGGDSIPGNLVLEEGAVLCNNENITVKGAGGGVTVIAGSVDMKGGAIERNTAYSGGGVALVNLSTNTFTMTSGKIDSNEAIGTSDFAFGGGAVYQEAGRFILDGGELTNNKANCGGGVMIYTSNSSFKIANGTIADNSAVYGGGMYVNECKSIELSGGSIINNFAESNGSGLLIAPKSTLKLSGDIQVTGNTSGDNALGDNLYLDGYVADGMVNMPNTVVCGDLSQAEIGISTWLKPEEGDLLPIAVPDAGYTITQTDLNRLSSDNSNYLLVLDDAGNIAMKNK